MNTSDWRSQLAPGWSPLNIGLMILLFVIFWPLGLAMVAYILWGDSVNLNLGQPGSLSTFGGNLLRAFKTGINILQGKSPDSVQDTGQSHSDFEQWRQSETQKITRERENLQRDIAQFKEEKSAFEKQRESV